MDFSGNEKSASFHHCFDENSVQPNPNFIRNRGSYSAESAETNQSLQVQRNEPNNNQAVDCGSEIICCEADVYPNPEPESYSTEGRCNEPLASPLPSSSLAEGYINLDFNGQGKGAPISRVADQGKDVQEPRETPRQGICVQNVPPSFGVQVSVGAVTDVEREGIQISTVAGDGEGVQESIEDDDDNGICIHLKGEEEDAYSHVTARGGRGSVIDDDYSHMN